MSTDRDEASGNMLDAKWALARTLTYRLGVCVLALVLVLGCRQSSEGPTTIRFWAMGREGEVVQELVPEFERENPDVHVRIEQIPWTVAHEKLLTAFVGDTTPDVAQLGNTWIAEFNALRALEPIQARLDASGGMSSSEYFAGIWETNVVDGVAYGVPWYVDTRVLFYRKDLLAQAGFASMPTTWDDWRAAMVEIKRIVGPDRFVVLLPANEWSQPVIFALQAGSPLLTDNATRGAFSEPEFTTALQFYVDLFRDGLAPPVRNNEISNLYQEFARGYFSMYITGPWNLGEFGRRMPEELRDAWGTAPLPGPRGGDSGVSLAGGSSLVLFRKSKNKDAAWRWVEFLSRAEQQVRFYELTGSLPARRDAWQSDALAHDSNTRAFGEQLRHVVSTPRIPEWEQIASRVADCAERVIRQQLPLTEAVAALDADATRLLEKRRWLLERQHASESGNEAP